jgi:hypothetical protein
MTAKAKNLCPKCGKEVSYAILDGGSKSSMVDSLADGKIVQHVCNVIDGDTGKPLPDNGSKTPPASDSVAKPPVEEQHGGKFTGEYEVVSKGKETTVPGDVFIPGSYTVDVTISVGQFQSLKLGIVATLNAPDDRFRLKQSLIAQARLYGGSAAMCEHIESYIETVIGCQ